MQNERLGKEIEGIFTKSKSGSEFLEKSEFIKKMGEAELDNPSDDPSLNKHWHEIMTDEKRMGDFWEYRKNKEWFEENFEMIEKKHRGQVVFVCNQAIIFSSGKSEKIKNEIRSLALGVEYHRYFYYYVPKLGESTPKPKSIH
ncbi:MAG: hypothetical protein A3B47_00775 [Candidatus Levybacteria bacterium RIFCSPLOWO2_01_FULL_39_24]|nr:MAG: hypothetical protein A2800_02805 [Candidatus Levybacteria bacterium RIFCSPHIGHO2_01_FULL_40_16]OGH45914.1 MAG: hypothetical protein A3B47_00775 [Candidatus Levybacteria bacterium RIFCSPLOWO2_01_FULL_39_24]